MASLFRAAGYSLATLFLSVAVLAAEAPVPTVKVEVQDRQNIEARIAYEVYTTTYTVNRWIAYMPEPPEMASQTNIKLIFDSPGLILGPQVSIFPGNFNIGLAGARIMVPRFV